tara:strand:- start:293 stop:559 length:267 start_codon:yes stop_codon:yes gene_type:complete
MKKHITTLAIIIIIISVTIAQKPIHPKNMKHENTESYQTKLNRIETQLEQIKAIQAEHKEEARAQNREEMTAKRNEAREKVHAILTNE